MLICNNEDNYGFNYHGGLAERNLCTGIFYFLMVFFESMEKYLFREGVMKMETKLNVEEFVEKKDFRAK